MSTEIGSPGREDSLSPTRHLLAASALAACLVAGMGFTTASAAERTSAARSAHAAPQPRGSSNRIRLASRTHVRSPVTRMPAPRIHSSEIQAPARQPELVPVIAPDMRASLPSDPRAACLAATRVAEDAHGVPRGLLTAIALAESGLHAYALSIGGRAYFPQTEEAARVLYAAAAPRRSIMAGCVQVNARVHARNSFWPLDPMRSADWAGTLLARWARETGSWPEALRRWHGGSPSSTRSLVCRVRAKMEVTNPGSTLFDGYDCNGMPAERTRRNGAVHLATAQRLSD